MIVKPAHVELNELLDRNAEPINRVLLQVADARVKRDPAAAREASDRLHQVLSETLILADLLGRRRLLLEFDAASRGMALSIGPVATFRETPVVPRVTFSQALEDLLSREPRLATTADQVRAVYRNHGFALVQSTELAVTERVKKALDDFLARGVPRPEASAVIREIGGYTKAYADTVYHNNVANAYSAGRFRQAEDPDVSKVILALRFNATRDADVRRGRKEDHGENHLAADGIIAPPGHQIWTRLATPLGHRCRCGLSLVSKFSLERMRLLGPGGQVIPFFPPGWEKATPAPGFGHRPDRAIYGAA